ncbi:MAG: Nif3-like dinuclear metal center hexameric protein [Oscillospiraceae bacterium]|nr:Nif3-like dinuclear metal center hexameric protein [Oscillospiraceae bacterium]
MTTVQTVYEFLKTLAPEHMAYDWDHVGLLCGRSDREVHKILVALDPFTSVCKEAKELGCELLVTHHPIVWKLEAVNDGTITGRDMIYLIENGISALNAHTNLDCAPGGVNDCLAARLGLTEVHVIDPMGTDAQGREYGLLRGGEISETEAEDFALRVKEALDCAGLRYVPGRKIRKVAVGGGSCGDSLYRIRELGYDALVTADCKYNQFADAAEYGITLIDAGHFQTENPVCTYVAEALQRAFPQVEVILSEIHRDPICFV